MKITDVVGEFLELTGRYFEKGQPLQLTNTTRKRCDVGKRNIDASAKSKAAAALTSSSSTRTSEIMTETSSFPSNS